MWNVVDSNKHLGTTWIVVDDDEDLKNGFGDVDGVAVTKVRK